MVPLLIWWVSKNICRKNEFAGLTLLPDGRDLLSGRTSVAGSVGCRVRGRGRAGKQRGGAETREPRPREKLQEHKVNGQSAPPREGVSAGICQRNCLLKNT